MIIKRKEYWGEIQYDTKTHEFSYGNKNNTEPPIVTKPIVLNCDLTFKCNLDCKYCVAKDMEKVNKNDLCISDSIIKNINQSPFMVVVLSGGEPLLPAYQSKLLRLVKRIKKKGIIIDTNGTIYPKKNTLNVLKKNNVLIRISMDSTRPQDEVFARIPAGKFRNQQEQTNQALSIYKNKTLLINKFVKSGLQVAIQTVLYKKNVIAIYEMPRLLNAWGIQKWYVQRFIPSYKFNSDKYSLESDAYENAIKKLEIVSKNYKLSCIAKKDKRHNCVFVMVDDGQIYTQSDEKPGEKVFVGKLGKIRKYFQFVSNYDHALRYYD